MVCRVKFSPIRRGWSGKVLAPKPYRQGLPDFCGGLDIVSARFARLPRSARVCNFWVCNPPLQGLHGIPYVGWCQLMIKTMSRYAPWRPYPRRYKLGSASCSYCRDGNHHRCRPLLDNRQCSCSCPRAEDVRLEASLLPHLSEQEQVKELDRLDLVPRTRKVKYGDSDIGGSTRINRQAIAEEAP